MKRRRFLSLALALMLIISLCACKTKVVDDSTDATHGNAPVTGQKRDETTTAPQTTKAPENTTLAQRKTEKGKLNPNTGTYTGLSPLPKIKLTATDPQNTRGLSTATVGYSYGVSKNGVPHQNSTNAQKYFDEKGFNAVSIDMKTKEKVLYLTFDCGWENGYTTTVLDILKQKNVPAAFFCTLSNIKAEPGLIARMINEGHIVGNHSTTHPDFSKISREKMATEIETCDNYLREKFGYSSPYFRFPMGSYSASALDLVSSLGYKSVFWSVAYADWDVNDTKGKQYAFDTVTSRLHPGAVILLHSVSPDNAAALGDIGQHFPDSDERYKGISSIALLKEVGKILQENGYMIENIDSTVIAQRPKLLPYRPQMAENIAAALGIEKEQVSVKATTEEGLGFTGSGEGISSQAVCMLSSIREWSVMAASSEEGCKSCGGCRG